MIPNCKQTKEQLKERGLYRLFGGEAITEGTVINLKRSINEFSFLILSTGGVGNYKYHHDIATPFFTQISTDRTLKPQWRANDTICILTATGQLTLSIIDENTLEINSVIGNEPLRCIAGVIL